MSDQNTSKFDPTSFSKNWRRALFTESQTIREAIECLEGTALQILLIVDNDNKLLGTVSDGDIRRGLLRGLTLNSEIESLVHEDPIVLPPAWPQDLVIDLMVANKVQQIPIVDEHGVVLGLHIWSDVNATVERKNVMVIMAGGQGTRLQPHTNECPKPMLQVGGTPMLEHIILRAKGNGIYHFIISIHYLGYVIEDYFGDGEPFGVKIEYLREKSPLGTAGALSLLGFRPKNSFIVTNGDVLTDIRYGELLDFHHRHDAKATMATRQHEWQNPFGVVRMDGMEIVGFEEKPINLTHINAGVYVLSPDVLELVEKDEVCDMPNLFDRIRKKNQKIIAYPMHEPWLDVGRPDDLLLANLDAEKG